MKIILIAGGAGFIGRHLCKELLKDNNKIICIDNLVTCNLDNIIEFIKNDNFTFINHDIRNDIILGDNIEHIDEIYNFACIASPDKYKIYSIETLQTCFIGTENLLKLAVKYNSKFLFASTSEIYGDPKQRKPNIDKAIEKLHFKPVINIEEGLKKNYKILYIRFKHIRFTPLKI
jgi:UDP-glucuronate decarboxylase